MRIPLKDLARAWPEELRAEIGRWNLPQLMVTVPAEQIDAGLSRARLPFRGKLCVPA